MKNTVSNNRTLNLARKILAVLVILPFIYITQEYFNIKALFDKGHISTPDWQYGNYSNQFIIVSFFWTWILILSLLYVVGYYISPNVRMLGKKFDNLDEFEKILQAKNSRLATTLSFIFLLIFSVADVLLVNSFISSEPVRALTFFIFSILVIISFSISVAIWTDKSDIEFFAKNKTEKDSTAFKGLKNIVKFGLTILTGVFLISLAGMYAKVEEIKTFDTITSFDLTGKIDAIIKIDPSTDKTTIKYSGSITRVSAVEIKNLDHSNEFYTHESLKNTASLLIQTSVNEKFWRPGVLKVEITTPKLEVVDAYGSNVRIEENCTETQDINQSFSAVRGAMLYIDCVKDKSKTYFRGKNDEVFPPTDSIFINGQVQKENYQADPANIQVENN